MRYATVSALLLALLVLPAWADDGDALRAQVRALFEARDADAQRAAMDTILAARPDPAQVAALLAQGRTYSPDVPTGWLERTNPCTDHVDRNWLLYVPEDYSPEKTYRLVVDMHGGVSRPVMLTHAELAQVKYFWAEHARANGYLLAIPAGQKNAEWWHEVGARNVLDVIRTVRREYNVDENRILATGFSDGGSGSYHLALAHTTPFAGFVPLNGHVGVAGVGGFQVHLRNLANKPIYAVNTERDSLYPSAGVKPFIDAMKKLGVSIVWRDIPEYRHEPTYLPQERPAIAAWMDQTERSPHPQEVVWEGAAGSPARVHWLNVTKVGEVGNDVAVEDANPMLEPGRVLIGITIDQAFEGSGLRVETVSAGTAAQVIGLEPDDVIFEFDGAKIDGIQDLRQALFGKKHGDAFTLRFRRDEEEISAEARFPVAKPRPAFRRANAWGSLRARVEGHTIDVQACRIAGFDLFLSPALVDLAAPVVVRVNGETVHEGVVEPDLAFMLSQALEDEDRTMVYLARLRLTVPPKAAKHPAKGD